MGMQDEVTEILQRGLDGSASVCIIRHNAESEPMYWFQRKDDGYPVAPFRNCLCLIGGNADAQETPTQTLEREISEELPPPQAQAVLSKARLWATFHIHVSAAAIGRSVPYAFVCSCFVADLCGSDLHDLRLNEGLTAALGLSDALNEVFCWGYQEVFGQYASEVLGQKSEL